MNSQPPTLIRIVTAGWVAHFCRIFRIRTDRGPDLVGGALMQFCDSFSCAVSYIPVGSARSYGLAARQIDLVKDGSVEMRSVCQGETTTSITQKVLAAKNLAPSITNAIAAWADMLGMSDLLSPMGSNPQLMQPDDDDGIQNAAFVAMQKHLGDIDAVRNVLQRQKEARGAARISNARVFG